MNEQELLRLLFSGDPRGIRSLVDQYQPMVLRTARGFVRNTEDARDIAQEVFISAITHINRFKGNSSLTTWLYRITVNLSLNHIRSNKRRNGFTAEGHRTEQGTDPVTQIADQSGRDPSAILEQKELSGILHTAMESLPDKQRTAFTLSEYDDLTYKEIAEVMLISLSSVESLIFRARKNLQKKLHKFSSIYVSNEKKGIQ